MTNGIQESNQRAMSKPDFFLIIIDNSFLFEFVEINFYDKKLKAGNSILENPQYRKQ